MRILTVFFLLTVLSLGAAAQSYVGGLQLEVKPSFDFQKGWKLSTKLSSRTLFFEGSNTESFNTISIYDRTELELVMTKKVSSSNTLGGGYLIRNQKAGVKHRLIQQFSISSKTENLSLGHRFRFDETFQKEKDAIYRFRYRFNLEKPLNSNPEKKGKTYLFVSNEYLPTLQNKDFQFEMRLFPGIGFKLDPKNKIEIGIDYRVEKLFTPTHKQIFLFDIAWLPSF